ncbi:MAG: hypothetical protein HXX09_07820, partial [Bacteroidetes bacterium]|nr:hypothetical protein [Bacteroidota bacterium]
MKIKKIGFLFFCFFLFSMSLIAQQQKIEWIKKGAVLTYDVKYQETNYQFIIRIINLKPDVSFSWEMTEPQNSKGKVNMSKEALATALKQNNFFKSGELFLTDMTTVWVSKKVFSSLKKAKPILIDLLNEEANLKFVKLDKKTFLIDGVKTKNIEVIYAETDLNQKYWILDSPDFPIILKMDLGWSIDLKSVET